MKVRSVLEPSLPLLVKIGSALVHADELLSPDGRELDKQVLLGLLNDPDVEEWIADMGALLPLKRRL